MVQSNYLLYIQNNEYLQTMLPISNSYEIVMNLLLLCMIIGVIGFILFCIRIMILFYNVVCMQNIIL
jgi:hypothetical protein